MAHYTVLGNTRIISPTVLRIPSFATLNSHPGLMEYTRGASPIVHAIRNGFPVGATIHFATESLDQGDVLLSDILTVHRRHTLGHVIYNIIELCSSLFIQVFDQCLTETLQPEKQIINPDQPVYRWSTESEIKQASEKLTECIYEHYAQEGA